MTVAARSEVNHGGKSPPWFTLAACALMIAIHGIAGAANAALIFDRQAIEAGEYWRLITGHLVHTGNRHLTWNVAALFVIGGSLEWEFGIRAVHHLLVLAAGAAGISAWLRWGMPGIERYSGFSAISNAQLVVFLATAWRRTRNPFFVAIGVGAMAKISVEILADESLLAAAAWPSLPETHGIGFLAGIALLLVAGFFQSPGLRGTTRAMG